MNTQHLYKRTTFRYRDGFAGNDNWEYIGQARMTPPRTTRRGADFDDGGTFVQHVKVSRGVKREDAINALQNLYMSHCQHDYDCCGCAHYSTAVMRVAPRRYVMTVRVGYNY